MLRNILIVAPFVTFPSESGSGTRFVYLAKLLSKNANVTLVTSRFHHFTKTQRLTNPILDGVSVVLIDQPAYKHNIGLKRIYSQHVFCNNLEKYLSACSGLAVVYSAYPLIRSNLILVKYRELYKFQLIVDVQDVWPEAIFAFAPVFRGRFGRFVMSPFTKLADKVYSSADALVAVSETYAARANIAKLSSDRCVVAYLGTDKLLFESKNRSEPSNYEKLVAIYLGTLGSSYDLDTVVRAAKETPEVQIVIVGSGPALDSLQRLAKQINSPAIFLGAVDYDTAVAHLMSADIAVNPIKGSALQSVTNKLSDYISAGLPIVSSQNNKEVRSLLGLGGGLSYVAGDVAGLASALNTLADDSDLRDEMSQVNRTIARELFYRPTSYEKIRRLVVSLAGSD